MGILLKAGIFKGGRMYVCDRCQFYVNVSYPSVDREYLVEEGEKGDHR